VLRIRLALNGWRVIKGNYLGPETVFERWYKWTRYP
jgi:hypothetical protein